MPSPIFSRIRPCRLVYGNRIPELPLFFPNPWDVRKTESIVMPYLSPTFLNVALISGLIKADRSRGTLENKGKYVLMARILS